MWLVTSCFRDNESTNTTPPTKIDNERNMVKGKTLYFFLSVLDLLDMV